MVERGRGSYNKFIIEDVNKDLSSIWLGSSQKIKLKPSLKRNRWATNPSSYSNPSIYLNSDRVFLNFSNQIVLS